MLKRKRVGIKEESSASPELGLGVGAALSVAVTVSSVVIAREECLFTEAEWRELQHQLFIFRHFQYGLSVPLQLVLPILKDVADTHGSGFAGLYKQFLSCMSSFTFCSYELVTALCFLIENIKTTELVFCVKNIAKTN